MASCPPAPQLAEFSGLLTENQMLHEGMRHHFEGFPPTAHPMAILSAMINAGLVLPSRTSSTSARSAFPTTPRA